METIPLHKEGIDRACEALKKDVRAVVFPSTMEKVIRAYLETAAVPEEKERLIEIVGFSQK